MVLYLVLYPGFIFEILFVCGITFYAIPLLTDLRGARGHFHFKKPPVTLIFRLRAPKLPLIILTFSGGIPPEKKEKTFQVLGGGIPPDLRQTT